MLEFQNHGLPAWTQFRKTIQQVFGLSLGGWAGSAQMEVIKTIPVKGTQTVSSEVGHWYWEHILHIKNILPGLRLSRSVHKSSFNPQCT